MKTIKVCYTNVQNAGDAVNPILIRKIFGYEPVIADQFHCDITGIGSGLRRFFVDTKNNSKYTRLYLDHGEKYRNRPVILWSAGFLSTPTGNEIPIKDQIYVASVRGKISKFYVEKLLGREVDCSVGDGGLLASLIVEKPQKPKYHFGIIPHRREKNCTRYQEIQKNVENSIIIDIEKADVIECLSEISQCECIISSSLHGLIFADSFCIPNIHVVLTNRLIGDGMKFDDYYSALGLEHESYDLNLNPEVDLNYIKQNYKINEQMIKQKQEEICAAFYRFLL